MNDSVNLAIGKANSRFGEIDTNRDNRLSLVEIQKFASQHKDEDSQQIARVLEDNFKTISDMHYFTRKPESGGITRADLNMTQRLLTEPDAVSELTIYEPTDEKKISTDSAIGLGSALLVAGGLLVPELRAASEFDKVASACGIGIAGLAGLGLGALFGANVDQKKSTNYYNQKLGDAQRMKI